MWSMPVIFHAFSFIVFAYQRGFQMMLADLDGTEFRESSAGNRLMRMMNFFPRNLELGRDDSDDGRTVLGNTDML
jgi:hypothetical protein